MEVQDTWVLQSQARHPDGSASTAAGTGDPPQLALVLQLSRPLSSGSGSAPCQRHHRRRVPVQQIPSNPLAFTESFLRGQHCCLLLVKVNYLGSFKENVSSQLSDADVEVGGEENQPQQLKLGKRDWLRPKRMMWGESWAGAARQPIRCTQKRRPRPAPFCKAAPEGGTYNSPTLPALCHQLHVLSGPTSTSQPQKQASPLRDTFLRLEWGKQRGMVVYRVTLPAKSREKIPQLCILTTVRGPVRCMKPSSNLRGCQEWKDLIK